jgi:hypothetical protein
VKIIKYTFILLLTVPVMFSCTPIETLPSVPSIEFKSFTIFDTTDILGNRAKGGRLNFYFEDGDGDLGLNDPLLPNADTTNIFFNLYRKTNGEIVPAGENDPLQPSGYRIPFMARVGQNKILRGTISITFLYLFYTPRDTIMYDFYIKDRAENLSNTVATNEIVISVNGVY